MSHIQKIKLKSGIAYRVHYRESGKQQSRYFPPGTPLSLVKSWSNQKELSIHRNKLYDIEPGLKPGLTLLEFGNTYIENRKNEINIKRHELTFQRMFKVLGFDIPVKAITTEKLTELRDALLDELLKNKYDKNNFKEYEKARRGVNNELSNVRTIMTWAYHKRYIEYNPFDRFDFYKNVSQPNIQLMTRQEERLFYKNLFTRHARLSYIIIRYSGLRRAEVRNLKYKDLDFENELIFIEKQKNRKLNRIIPMHPILKRLLKLYGVKGDPDEFIFTYAPDYLSRYFREACQRAGLSHIKSPVHVHRHAFVTNVLKSTGDLALASEMARHSTYNVTRRYLHLLPENLKKRFSKVTFR